ncbi:MAG: hypothetical protein PSU93_08460 [Methylobacter sp.]|uniref:Carboxypeptidase regulatory-like domain-containing protein n=1 Tax=Candidatus Methylobacter titanis TaxID=3053457 RepID=A0AA43Q5M9_9GAMM|nr:hypothetical protein [Candidatus Methylobacter titanis]
MKSTYLKKAFVALSILVAVGHAGITFAHDAGALIDGAGNNASATDLAAVTCTDDGNGVPHHLFGRVKDSSSPVPGLLVNFHIYKGQQMTTSTDPVSGDDNYSPGVSLNGGPGTYYISVTKTSAGARDFNVIWHCVTSDNKHTGTDITVLQIQ